LIKEEEETTDKQQEGNPTSNMKRGMKKWNKNQK